ncbi:MAG: F0F1 ATP synthase subunit A [Planctomycetota bacterium]
MASPLEDPLSHSIDTDVIHLPGGRSFDVFQWTGDRFGTLLDMFGLEGLSKFMALEVLAAGLLLITFIPLAVSLKRRGYPKSRLANVLETMLLFIRDQVAVPAIGHHDANKFVPFLWSIFTFILFCNLLGMFPFLGSPTGALGCTGGLAFVSFLMIHVSGMRKLGTVGYAKAFVPHVPLALYPLMLVIEIIGHTIKPVILAVRLFVNILAGHTVLFVILGFIAVIGPSLLYFIVTPASILGVVLLSFLELFVAFLQAYVFTFLTAIFIGAAVHPHH